MRSQLSSSSPKLSSKGKSASPSPDKLRNTKRCLRRNTIYLLTKKKKASTKRERKGCPTNADGFWQWLSAARPKAASSLPSHHGRAAKNWASFVQCPLERKKKKREAWKKTWARKSIPPAQTHQPARSRGEWEAAWGGLAAHPQPGSQPLKGISSPLLLLPLQPPSPILTWLCTSHVPTSKYQQEIFPHPMPSYAIHHMLVFPRNYANLGSAHQYTRAHFPSPRGTRYETLLALSLVGSAFPMLARCMVGESKTNPSATLTSPPVNHYDKPIVQNKNTIWLLNQLPKSSRHSWHACQDLGTPCFQWASL